MNLEQFLKTNTLNFIIMLLILAWIYKKVNLSALFERLRAEIATKVQNSIEGSNKAIIKLITSQRNEKKVMIKASKIITRAKKSARAIQKKSELEKQNAIKSVNRSVKKSFMSQFQKAKTSLEKDITKASFEKARTHIVQILDHDMQRQYIEDAINSLDEVEFQ